MIRILAALAVAWLSLVTVGAFADIRSPVEHLLVAEQAFAQAQPPLTERQFVTPSTSPAPPPLQPDAEGNISAYDVLNYGTVAAILTMIGMAWRTLRPIILAVAGFFGQREQAMALAKEANQVALAQKIAKLSLDYVLQTTGVSKDKLTDLETRYALLKDANEFATDQWPDDWGKWILSGMTLPEKVPPQIAQQSAQIAFFEAAAAEHLPPVDHSKKPAPAAAAA